MSEKTILLTGANGFLGTYLLHELIRSGRKVKILLRRSSDTEMISSFLNKVEICYGDVLDIPSLEDAMEGADQIIHAAAMISFDPEMRLQMRKVNVEGTANVVNVALYSGISRMLFVSSVAAFGRAARDRRIDEQIPGQDDASNYHYHRSKFHAENEVWRGNAEGLNTVIVNPGTILGAGRWDLPPLRLFKEVKKGLPFSPSGSMGFIDVRDVARACVGILDHSDSGSRYILSAENMSYSDLIREIAEVMNVKNPGRTLPAWLLPLAARFEKIRAQMMNEAPAFYAEELSLSAENYCLCGDKAKSLLNMQYRSVKQTVHDTAKLFLSSEKTGAKFAVFTEE